RLPLRLRSSPASFQSKTRHAPPWRTMQNSAMNAVLDVPRRRFSFPNAADGCRVVQPVARSPGCLAPSRYERQRENRRVGRGPRLQDFRHSFATRRLINWYRAGLDVGRELSTLATYLGHVDVGHTYWYIEAVSGTPPAATERLDGHQPGGAQ